MSEATENAPAEATETAATDAEVNEAFEELVKNVEVPSEVVAPKKKAAAKPRKAVKDDSAQKNVDALVDSVSSLVRSVEALTERIPVPAETPIADAPETATLAEVPVEPTAVADDEDHDAVSLKDVAVEHGLTLGTFLGLGLVAAGAMQSGVAAISMTAAGVAMFVGAAVARSRGNIVKSAGAAVLTVLGLGLIVGGAQFFGDEPKRAAVLIPLGLPLFMVGTVLRSGWKLSTEHISWVAGAAVWLCLGLFMGLNTLADSMTKDEAKPEVPAAPAAATPAADAHGAAPADAHGAEDHGAAAETHAADAAHAPADSHAAEAATDAHAANKHGESNGAHAAEADAHGAAESHATKPDAHATDDKHAAKDDHAKPETAAPAKVPAADLAATVGKINASAGH